MPFFTIVEKLDVRPRFVSIRGQEVLSSDGVTLKLSLAAKLLEGNPNLMQLRLVQALGEASGNTVILGMPSQSVPVPVRAEKQPKEIRGKEPETSQLPPEPDE